MGDSGEIDAFPDAVVIRDILGDAKGEFDFVDYRILEKECFLSGRYVRAWTSRHSSIVNRRDRFHNFLAADPVVRLREIDVRR